MMRSINDLRAEKAIKKGDTLRIDVKVVNAADGTTGPLVMIKVPGTTMMQWVRAADLNAASVEHVVRARPIHPGEYVLNFNGERRRFMCMLDDQIWLMEDEVGVNYPRTWPVSLTTTEYRHTDGSPISEWCRQ